MRSFRELVDSAIENRQPLDTAEFARLAEGASPPDRDYWRCQVRLDQAVGAWMRSGVPSPRRPVRVAGVVAAAVALKTWQGVRSAHTAAVLALGLSAVIVWSSREPTPPAPDAASEPVLTFTPAEPTRDDLLPAVAPKPVRGIDDSRALALSTPRRSFEEATETTRRLAYAFEPVGEQVGTVVRFLIDAVPGADVFSM